MTLGEKLSRCRLANNLTQEQVAALLGVSRQAISQWERDAAFPETERLIRLAQLYDCSMDYLLTDKAPRQIQPQTVQLSLRLCIPERTSTRRLWGLPLWQIGRNARAVFAVGLRARGLVAVGILSCGVFSLGFLSVGILATGLLALGLLSAGTIAAGIFSVGAISLGLIAAGAIAVGDFSAGALSIGKYLAIGDHARAMVALGRTEAVGSVYQAIVTQPRPSLPKGILENCTPAWLVWAAQLARRLFLHT